jgi:hypothetical protein
MAGAAGGYGYAFVLVLFILLVIIIGWCKDITYKYINREFLLPIFKCYYNLIDKFI